MMWITDNKTAVTSWGLMYEDLHGFLTKTLWTQKSYAPINPDVSSLHKHTFTQILFVIPNESGIERTCTSTTLRPISSLI